ncbi:rhamnogalacturonan lyase family protein [Paenibacillus dauci]|uniref:rhamnogalacturonan lyase family protein n=1 Tax=Paenibacillus dauci TaxID=1567106 RepID=UPI0006198DAF|nr:cadherin-like beta sandwich domain-containing protein [Paenibacillus dauci]
MHFYKSKTVTKQIVSKVLMIIMILSLVVPAVPASVKAENTVLVNEDFSSYPAGPFTIGSGNAWGKEGSAPVVQIARETVTGMTYAEIKNTSSGSSYIGQRFAAQTGGLIAEFDIRVPGNNGGSLYMMDGKINATSAAAVNTGMGAGSIQGTQSSNRIAYDPSTWYRLQYVINIPAQTYTTTITDLSTGSIVAEWQDSFRNKVARISSFGLYLGRDGGTIQLANAHVTNLDLNLSSLQVKSQDFTPAFTPAFDPSVLNYQMEVPYSVNTLDITPTASDADKVQLSVGKTTASSGTSASVILDGATTSIPVRVTSDTYSDISRTYTLNVTRLEKYPDLQYVVSEPHNGKVKIGWEETIDPTYTEAHIYQVQKNQKLKLVNTVARGTYISTIDKLKNNTTYTFVVKAAFEDGSESTGVTIQETPVKLPPRQMEYLDRGLVAIPQSGGVYVSWRLLGTDPDSIGFDLYRDGKKVNSGPIRSTTNFMDKGGSSQSTYYVQAVGGKVGPKQSETAKVWNADHLSIPLRKPADGKTVTGEVYSYSANDATTADLDGDGQYEIILKWAPSNAKDNSQSGHTGSTLVDAYKLDGSFLWRVTLGPNIRSGAHYLDVMAYDLDGDGKAEVAFRTADGTVDGQGKVIGNASARYANDGGYILTGPEYFSIFEGTTGRELITENYEPARGDVNSWGDGYGNRVDRFLAAIAYLDGERPSLVMQRGYYTRMVLVAYDWRDGKLTKRWTFDSSTPGNEKYAGQGNHQLSVADVDNDGKDEIITGAAAIDHNGSGLWVSGLGHGDAMHVSDLNPQRLGLEEWAVQEHTDAPYSADLKDARTGRVLWGQAQLGVDVGRGLSADIDPRHPGAEMWAIDGEWNSATGGLFTAAGEKISSSIPSSNFAIWWDGDLSRELLDHTFSTEPVRQGVPKIDKWDYANQRLRNLITFTGNLSNNDTKGNPALQADILGDWREELVLRNTDSTELRIYSTTEQTNYRLVTLMHDAVYRLGIAWQNTGYNQPPHTSYYLGTGMEQPEQPNIRVIQPDRKS